MSNLGLIKLNGKTYGYDAYFDEVSGKWYFEVCDGKGKTVHTSESTFANYPAAIQASAKWVKADSK